MYKDKRTLFFGLILILMGIMVLLGNLNFIPQNIQQYIFRWESILILSGLLMIFVRGRIFSGTILVALGTYFLADDIFTLPANWKVWFWPSILILLGVGFITKPTNCQSSCKDKS